MEQFYRLLPYRLTGDQQRVIARDRRRHGQTGNYFNRLLQGNVGSGKTAVSMAAMITACENGYQAAFMVPTEILAQQHFATIGRWAGQLGLQTEVLIGGGSAAAKKAA